MKQTGLLLIAIILQLSALSQTKKITIKVLDIKTQKYLPYANICFEDIKSHKKYYTVTNQNGIAENICKTPCVISISSVGYKILTDTLLPQTSKTFELYEDVFNLNQVVVTATRTKKILKDAPVITQIISEKDISDRGITNVREVLEQDIPGLEFQRGGFGTDIKMQGLEAKNILILIDGERLAGENANNIDYSRINPENIEKIEIVKGASSALYGSQAMGGVINIITKKSRKRFEASVSSQWTQKNETNYSTIAPDDPKYIYKDNLDLPNLNFNASVGFNFNKISGRTDFSAKSFDAYRLYDKKQITKEFTDIDTVIHDTLNPLPTGISGYEDYSINQKFNIRLNNKVKIKLNGSFYSHNEYDFVPDNVFQKYIDYNYGGKIIYNIKKDLTLTASFHYDSYKKYDFFEKLSEKELNYNNTIINPKLIFSGEISQNHLITGGGELFFNSLLSDKFLQNNLIEYSNITSVAFIQDDYNLSDKWNFIAGIRGDFHSEFGSHFSPKISAMYKLKTLIFRANYANGFRSPSLKELYMDWDIAWFTIKGDENLQPETNNYFSASVEFTKSFINTSATVYYNNLKNKIDGVWKENQTVYQYVNVSEAELSGVELLAKIKLPMNFMLGGGYSFLHDKRPQGDLVSSASPHSGNVKLIYNFSHTVYNLNIILLSTIIGAKDFYVTETIDYRGKKTEGMYPVHFDAYSICKIAVSQKFMNGIVLTAGIDNIFNYTADIVSFNTSTTPGRRGFISLKIDIDKLIK
jgi:outer membrane receptor for ferrienterochelin and colicins